MLLVANLFSSALWLATSDLLLPCSLRRRRSAPWTRRSSRMKSSGERANSTLVTLSTSGSPRPNTSSSSSAVRSLGRLPRATSEDGQLRTSTKNCSMASTVLFQNIERLFGFRCTAFRRPARSRDFCYPLLCCFYAHCCTTATTIIRGQCHIAVHCRDCELTVLSSSLVRYSLCPSCRPTKNTQWNFWSKAQGLKLRNAMCPFKRWR